MLSGDKCRFDLILPLLNTSLNLHKMILSSIITETPCRLRDYIQPLRKTQEEEQCKPFSRLQEKKVGSNFSQGLASITLRFETSFIDLFVFGKWTTKLQTLFLSGFFRLYRPWQSDSQCMIL